MCPAGDLDWITVTVQETPPLPGTWVECHMNQWGSDPICICPGESPQSAQQNAAGIVTLTFKKAGGCGHVEFIAYSASGATSPTWGPVPIQSPDINGDCYVELADFIIFAGIYMSGNRCGDYDCDGDVDLVDFICFATHYFDQC